MLCFQKKEEMQKELKNCKYIFCFLFIFFRGFMGTFVTLPISCTVNYLSQKFLLFRILCIKSSSTNFIFGLIFIVMWIGSLLVTINAKLLKARMIERINQIDLLNQWLIKILLWSLLEIILVCNTIKSECNCIQESVWIWFYISFYLFH